jgi:hypothetical protein
MGAEALSSRGNWQRGARITGDKGELKVAWALSQFLPDYYNIQLKPEKIMIYEEYDAGIELDLLVTNTRNNISLFIEVKTGNKGGNATEERATKFLSRGIKTRVMKRYNTPDNPFFMIFGGHTFTGKNGKLQNFIIERTSKKTGKITKTTVKPMLYRKKVQVQFEGENNYAFLEMNFENAQEIANQIMNIMETV